VQLVYLAALLYFYEMIEFLNTISSKALKVVDENISLKEYTPISISSENKALASFDVSSSSEWESFLDEYLKSKKAKVAFGGYIEERDIYKRSAYFNTNDEEERNIHLGLDLWCDAGTNVLSVLDGEIHSFKNNLNHGDYGPTIIVKHTIEQKEFYSLYGHLSVESLDHIKIGQRVKQGEVIATLGKSEVNGDYAPHLHFQLIIDIENYEGDYPGVTSKKDLDFYKRNCPNPNLLLKLPNEI
jgi:murein DD-endopeptidase MepM/ murein hydrolase activator NlpD